MTHPLIDECSVPMRVRAVEYVFGDDCEWTPVTVDPRDGRLTSLHRYLPCRDPAGAPSGLRWRLLEHGGWRLWRWDRFVGAVITGARPWASVAGAYAGHWRSVARGDLDWCARELVREVGTPRATPEGDAP